MEGVKIEDIDYNNHEIKCRICFKIFGEDEHRVEISSLLQKKFYEVTQTNVNSKHKFMNFINNSLLQLNMSDEYSREVCVICNYQLTNCWQFKKNVILSQANLYKFSRENQKHRKKAPEVLEVFLLKIQSDIKEEFDTEMIVKSDFNEDEFKFSSYDDLKLEAESENDVFEEADASLVLENHAASVRRRKRAGKSG